MIWIYLFLVTLFIRPQDWIGNPFYGWPVNVIIVVCGLFFALFTGSSLNRKKAFSLPQNYFIAALLLIAFVSNAANGSASAGTEQFVAFIKRAIVYLMFLLYIDSSDKLRNVFVFSMLLTVILSIQGMYQTAHDGVGWAHQTVHSLTPVEEGGAPIPQMDGARTFWIGLWDGPNVLCLAYLMPVAFAFGSFLNFKKNYVFGVVSIVCFLFLCYGIYQTNSRGGFLTLGFIVMLYLVTYLGAKKGFIVALLFIPVLLLFSPSRMNSVNTEEESAHERTWLWEQGLSMFRENKVFGIGIGQFSSRAGLVAHNNYVSFLSESGITGFMVYMALMYLSIKSCVISYRAVRIIRKDDPVVFLSVVVGVTVAGFALATFFVLMLHDIIFIYWAMSANVFLIAKQKCRDLELRFTKKDWAAVSALAVSIIIAVWKISGA